MATVASALCTDEAIAIRALGDFPTLVPAGQRFAFGTDGSFSATSGGSWVLSSASVNFANNQVAAGNIMLLKMSAQFSQIEPLAVDSVSGSTV